jgi:hypothetical protein
MKNENDSRDPLQTEARSPKKSWTTPKVEVAAGRDAEAASAGRGGDYGAYS